MNQNALFNRGLNNENVYGNQQRKMKRNRYYQLKVLKGECGVVSIKSKPWFAARWTIAVTFAGYVIRKILIIKSKRGV